MMPEYIERGAANEALRECVRVYPTSFYNGIEVARAAIHKLSAAADVVEVVRCKDCEFNDDGYRCPFREAGWGYDPDRYCSFGERKEGEG